MRRTTLAWGLVLAVAGSAAAGTAIVVDGTPACLSALATLVELAQVGDELVVYAADGAIVLDPTVVSRRQLRERGGLSGLMARRLPERAAESLLPGLCQALAAKITLDRLLVITGSSASALARDLGDEALALGSVRLVVLSTSRADPGLLGALARHRGALIELEPSAATVACARAHGGLFYRTRPGAFLLPDGGGDLLIFAPSGVTVDVRDAGGDGWRGREVEHELERGRLMRLETPAPGAYELAGAPVWEGGMAIARLPWRLETRLTPSGGLEAWLARSPTAAGDSPAVKANVVATFTRSDGGLDRLQLAAVPGGAPDSGDLYRAQLVGGTCGQIILDVELLAPDLDGGPTGWRTRDIFAWCPDAARPPAAADDGSAPPSAAPESPPPAPEPSAQAVIIAQPASVRFDSCPPGGRATSQGLHLSWSDGRPLGVLDLRVELRDARGVLLAATPEVTPLLPASLAGTQSRLALDVRLGADALPGEYRGEVILELRDAGRRSLPASLAVELARVTTDPAQLTLEVEESDLPLVRDLELGLDVRGRMLGEIELAAGFTGSGILPVVDVPALVRSAATGSGLERVPVVLRLERGLTPGRHAGWIRGRGRTIEAFEVALVLDVRAAAIPFEATPLHLTPTTPSGAILAGSQTARSPVSAPLELAAKLTTAPAGATILTGHVGDRLWVVVHLPDDAAGAAIAGSVEIRRVGATDRLVVPVTSAPPGEPR